MILSRALASSVLAVALLAPAHEALAQGKGKGSNKVKYHPDWARHPSTRYAALTAETCLAELAKRNIAATRVESALGVLAPVRLPKGVGGVLYRTEVGAHLRDTNPFDVFDCRLVLALSDFSKILVAHDIDEVLMFSAWRPPSTKHWQPGKLGTRHPGALAIDVFRFGKKLGKDERPEARVWLDVLADFHGTIGPPVCGEGAPPPAKATPAAKELQSIVCEVADQHIFTSILTPNYNRAHRNHFHLEVTPEVRWYLVR